jgi:hypothetical protein
MPGTLVEESSEGMNRPLVKKSKILYQQILKHNFYENSLKTLYTSDYFAQTAE